MPDGTARVLAKPRLLLPRYGGRQSGLFAIYDARFSVYCGVISTKISAGGTVGFCKFGIFRRSPDAVLFVRCQYRTGRVRDIFMRCPDRSRRFALILYLRSRPPRCFTYRGGRAFISCYRVLCVSDERGFAFRVAVLAVKIIRFMSLVEIPVHMLCRVGLTAFVYL